MKKFKVEKKLIVNLFYMFLNIFRIIYQFLIFFLPYVRRLLYNCEKIAFSPYEPIKNLYVSEHSGYLKKMFSFFWGRGGGGLACR